MESPKHPSDINHSYDHWWDDSPEARKKRKQERIDRSLIWLRERGIELVLLNPPNAHYRYEIFDYWPTSQVFMNRVTKKLGKGLWPFYDAYRKYHKTVHGFEYVPYKIPNINEAKLVSTPE